MATSETMKRPEVSPNQSQLHTQLMHSQQSACDFGVSGNPREDWRGFSFGYFYFYFSFSNQTPFSAGRQRMPE
jgi:hypothetical protein